MRAADSISSSTITAPGSRASASAARAASRSARLGPPVRRDLTDATLLIGGVPIVAGGGSGGGGSGVAAPGSSASSA